MKIIMNIKEIALYKKSFEDISKITGEDAGKAIADLKEYIDKNPLINYRFGITGLEIIINPGYIVEYMDLYGKYANVIIPQVKSLVTLVQMFAEDSAKLLLKYQTPETTTEDKKGEE